MRTFILSFIIFLSPSIIYAEKSNLALGKAVYEETCISCHGVKGETNPEMKLVVTPRKLNETILTEDQSFQIVKYGAHHWGAHSELMSSFKSVYTEEQLYAVATYISTTFNSHRTQRIQDLLNESTTLSEKEEKSMLKVGGKIFKRRCAWCHGETGNGESTYVEASKDNKDLIYPYNLTRTLLDEDQIFLYAKYGGHFWGAGSDDMPSWKKKYNDVKLKSVAYFIETQIKKIKKK
ncbi:c-type cytochrome [Sulfurimonas sp. SAG-AH-194-C21]|nr:c-type cytochrome [Sulfurimonas sp. SAG-AH-194-C21]MDF1883437.1 c-type cytochrome [Sulfurimonas sp. SAG-AH-194-C21]